MAKLTLKNTEVSDRKKGTHAPSTLDVRDDGTSIVVTLGDNKDGLSLVVELGLRDAMALQSKLNEALPTENPQI